MHTSALGFASVCWTGCAPPLSAVMRSTMPHRTCSASWKMALQVREGLVCVMKEEHRSRASGLHGWATKNGPVAAHAAQSQSCGSALGTDLGKASRFRNQEKMMFAPTVSEPTAPTPRAATEEVR